ncbi:MAG: RdgB/HAM1 family non-canonical purine NTP pyrophosphatase [bacterium]|nr:RdgB/HAM1 family non-canonical purine NTP pyrophosphatase [bacterium]
MSRLVIASKNEHKIVEILDVLDSIGLDVELVRDADWPDVAETEATLEGNALLKARSVRAETGFAVIADDTGLEVDALDGAPGVRSARFSGAHATYEGNVDKLLDVMDGVANRSARFRTVMVLIDDNGTELVVEGVMNGSITNERRGNNGFGYDPVFLVGDRTFAEMPTAEKNAISHRAQALRALAGELAAN